jgi:hypothetical protein
VRDGSGYNPLVSEEDRAAGERQRIADELRRIREAVRDRALLGPGGGRTPAPPAVRTPEALRMASPAAASPTPPRPDNAGVNDSWRIRSVPAAGGGIVGRLARAVRAMLGPTLEAQEAFNSKQVQLDNELLAYIDARLEATHRHYDEVLGIHGRHMGEIDERHLILQEELVAHVHDLVRRVDLVLSEAERGRLSLEFALRDLRARVEHVEQRLRGAAEGRTGPG